MTSDRNHSISLLLCRGSHGDRVTVDLDSFLEFSAKMDENLGQLIDDWSEFIRPSAPAGRIRREQRG